MDYQVMSPRGEVDPIKTVPLNPRITDLNKATVGLFASFKAHWVSILEEVARQLKERYPGVKFARFQYTRDLSANDLVGEVRRDDELRPKVDEFLKGVDAVIGANGDAGSCTLYLTYNTSYAEERGKPAVMLLNKEFTRIADRAAALRGVYGMRYVIVNIPDMSYESSLGGTAKDIMARQVAAALGNIIAAITTPLTEAEKNPPKPPENLPRIVHKGTLQEINSYFRKKGWAYGMPIIPPTEEAVREMLAGTDLPANHVVANLPPMNGKATVERIAVNGVMAGCLPIDMPVLIAAVKALVEPGMWLEAYTCSVASWEPLLIINGPIRHDLHINSGVSLFSPYHRSNASIAHAVGLMIMNIAGIEFGREDAGIFGHEGHFGVCIAENEEGSKWEPLHQYYGLNKEDSAVTIFWPHVRTLGMFPRDLPVLLKGICDLAPFFGFDPGCAFILCPETANFLYENGFTKKEFVRYIVEYARRPTTEVNVRWMKGNNHLPHEVPLPGDPTRSARKFFSSTHLPVVVAGMDYGFGVAMYGGGGDHGGPVTRKIDLPKNWPELLAKYQEI